MESGSFSPGSLLREARTRANLSQTDVARRAHVAQSVVSAYESGRREPSFGTLERLIAATGHRLEIRLEPAPDARPGLPDTPLDAASGNADGRCSLRPRNTAHPT